MVEDLEKCVWTNLADNYPEGQIRTVDMLHYCKNHCTPEVDYNRCMFYLSQQKMVEDYEGRIR